MAVSPSQKEACNRKVSSVEGDDYYTILGVDPTATPREIREAWIGRLSVYHPDRHPEKAAWFTQKAM